MLERLTGRLPGPALLRAPFERRPYLVERPDGPSKRWAQSATALAQHHVRVVDVVRETEDAVTLVLECIDGTPVRFRAGQYLTHCFSIDGREVRRAYSICLPEGDRLACTVKAIDGGVASSYALSRVSTGTEYPVLGPSGDFALPDDADAPLAFLAAGSGIAPVVSMIETTLRRHPERRIRLLYASRHEDAIIFADRLDRLAREHPHLEVQHVISQPRGGWNGPTGRLTGEQVVEQLRPGHTAHVFLCGPTGLMDAATEALRAAGTAEERIHREHFYAAPQHTAEPPTEPQELVFAASGRTVTQRPGETILEAGLRHGLKLDFSCTVGGCAACRLRVTEGRVALDEPNCLTPEERAAGQILSCSAYATERVVLDA